MVTSKNQNALAYSCWPNILNDKYKGLQHVIRSFLNTVHLLYPHCNKKCKRAHVPAAPVVLASLTLPKVKH